MWWLKVGLITVHHEHFPSILEGSLSLTHFAVSHDCHRLCSVCWQDDIIIDMVCLQASETAPMVCHLLSRDVGLHNTTVRQQVKKALSSTWPLLHWLLLIAWASNALLLNLRINNKRVRDRNSDQSIWQILMKCCTQVIWCKTSVELVNKLQSEDLFIFKRLTKRLCEEYFVVAGKDYKSFLWI